MMKYKISLFFVILIIPLVIGYTTTTVDAELVSAPTPTVTYEVVNGQKVYKITGVRLNDNPKVITAFNPSGESIMDIYNRNPNALPTYITFLIENHEFDSFLEQHTGWSASVRTFTDGIWKEKPYSTRNGFLGEKYSYNQVSEAMANLNYLFPDDLKQAIATMDKNAKLFETYVDSRDQTVRIESLPAGGIYVPASAATNPVEGNKFVLYYNNDVYLDVKLPALPCPNGTCEPPPTTTPGSCSIDIAISNGSQMNKSNNASPSGSIYSSTGAFDVVAGIPTSEDVSVSATSQEYLFTQSFQQINGTVTYNGIEATKDVTYTWTEEKPGAKPKDPPVKTPKSEQETLKTTVGGITRTFSYWTVKQFDIWQAFSALFTNYALPNGQATATGSVNVSANAKHNPSKEAHVFPSPCPTIVLPAETISGGNTKPPAPDISGPARAEAESKIKDPQVKNDRATFKGSTLMSDALTVKTGPTPSNVPDSGMATLTKTYMTIDKVKTNYHRSPSTGLFNYSNVFSLGGAGSRSFPFAVNDVTVHTPTVIYASTSDDKEHDQRINPPLRSTPIDSDTEIAAFILDRPFTVKMPTIGQHRSIPGYGNRDYQKYIKEKMVKFPFDVYSETKMSYYPSNTWIKVPVDMQEAHFFMPVWVTEGRYTVEFKAIAENAPASAGGEEQEANITIPNGTVNGNPSAAHTAIDSLQVDVVGRLYDLQITDVMDHNWQYMFRSMDNLTQTGNKFNVGLQDIDGAARGNVEPFTLPISHASNTNGLLNNAVKLGYTFKFDLKTKGDMQSIKDAIRITPTFYFVSDDGRVRQEVDLYYNDNQNSFVKIGSPEDNIYREVILNETSRFVPINELSNNAYHYYDFAERYHLEDITKDYFRTGFAMQYVRKLSKEPIKTGPYAWQLLNWHLRTYRGPSKDIVGTSATMIPKEDLVTKEQTWYGEYSLPSETYAIPKGTDLASAGAVDDTHSIFLRNGYIVVNFDLETINEGNTDNPYLSYSKARYMSQWQLEGGKTQFTDGYGNDFVVEEGDMLYYHANKSVENDYSSSVTH